MKSFSISTESLEKNDKELTQLEDFLDMQSKNFAGPKISEIIKELCIKGNFPIEQMIFKEQFRLVEQKQLELIEKAKNQQEIFENKIKDLTKTIEEHEVEVYYYFIDF